MPKITGNAVAWVAGHNLQNSEAINLKNADPDMLMGQLSFQPLSLNMETEGWLKIGSATITVDIPDNDTLTQHQIKALETQVQTIHAEAQRNVNRIRDRISKLQALTFDGATTNEGKV